MSTTPDVRAAIDGRTARAVRTREAIVDACIELVESGDLRPTAPRIAERAGVSVRSIFQHFDDLETLFASVGERVVGRLSSLLAPVDAEAAPSVRIAAFVRQRAQVNEAMTPIRRAAFIHATGSDVVRDQFAAGHRLLRAEIERVFGAELAAAGAGGPVLLDTLVLATSWPTWDVLRTLEAREVDDAYETVLAVVSAALAAASPRTGSDPGPGGGPVAPGGGAR